MISAIAGVILVRHPIRGVAAVALIRTFEAPGRRVWPYLLAAVELIAGIPIVSSPEVGVATLALFVGISFIVRGFGLCEIAWVVHALGRGAPPRPRPIPCT